MPKSSVNTDPVILKVTSPVMGDTFKMGMRYDILWSFPGDAATQTGSIYAQSVSAADISYLIAERVDLRSGRLSWKAGEVVSDLGIPPKALPSGLYNIKICYNKDQNCVFGPGFTLEN